MMENVTEQWRLEATIGLLAANLDSMERTRIQAGNRAAQAMRSEPDADGVMRGLGMPENHPLIRLLVESQYDLLEREHVLERALIKQIKQHPLAPWIESKRGLGWKTMGRLIGTIGDPYLRTVVREDGTWAQTPRGVYQLWKYCGFSVEEDGSVQTRRRGQQGNWNPDARKRMYIISLTQRYGMKNAYRPVYDQYKELAASSVHSAQCSRCGPAGTPAPAGSPLGKMHIESRALRRVSKTILKEMWCASRDLHRDAPADSCEAMVQPVPI